MDIRSAFLSFCCVLLVGLPAYAASPKNMPISVSVFADGFNEVAGNFGLAPIQPFTKTQQLETGDVYQTSLTDTVGATATTAPGRKLMTRLVVTAVPPSSQAEQRTMAYSMACALYAADPDFTGETLQKALDALGFPSAMMDGTTREFRARQTQVSTVHTKAFGVVLDMTAR